MLNGENTADCALARNGRPVMMCGFHSGMWGSELLVKRVNGWITAGASSTPGLAARWSVAGLTATHG